jgi:hypothetical protein
MVTPQPVITGGNGVVESFANLVPETGYVNPDGLSTNSKCVMIILLINDLFFGFIRSLVAVHTIPPLMGEPMASTPQSGARMVSRRRRVDPRHGTGRRVAPAKPG